MPPTRKRGHDENPGGNSPFHAFLLSEEATGGAGKSALHPSEATRPPQPEKALVHTSILVRVSATLGSVAGALASAVWSFTEFWVTKVGMKEVLRAFVGNLAAAFKFEKLEEQLLVTSAA